MTSSVLFLAVLICDVGGPGSTTQAQPTVDQFLRQLETVGGWKADALQGAYHTEPGACEAYLNAQTAALGVFALPDYLRLARSWKLAPLAQVGEEDAQRYVLLVRDGSTHTPTTLKGQRVMVPQGISARFVNRIVLGTKKKVAETFDRVPTTRPLQAVRAVARGEAEAALVDAAVAAHLAELSLPETLTALHRSPPLPKMTVATVGRVGTATDRAEHAERLRQALPNICADDGADLCRTFGVTGFTEADPKAYRALLRRYR